MTHILIVALVWVVQLSGHQDLLTIIFGII
jgi:hypothetical protein